MRLHHPEETALHPTALRTELSAARFSFALLVAPLAAAHQPAAQPPRAARGGMAVPNQLPETFLELFSCSGPSRCEWMEPGTTVAV
jgi:hypothetical protein